MTTEHPESIDRASALGLPIELLASAAQSRGIFRRVFPDDRIDNRLTPSGHCRQQANQ